MQANKHTVAWTAPEILEGGGTITREADVFAFGMVVIEVGLRPPPPIMLEMEGCIVRLMFASRIRFLQECLRSVNLQPRSLFQRLWTVNARLARRRKN